MTSDRNTLLAEQLQQWAQANGVERDPYVARLINALARQQDLGYWATIDPLDALPLPTPSSVSRHLAISRRLAMWRNIIIFVPLALTWYSIAEATSAFEVFLSRNATSTANFLEFWQNGYGILPDFWRIGSVARADVLIIIVIIIMSLASGLLHARAQRTDSSDRRRAEHERSALALDLGQYLHSMRDVTPATVDGHVADALALLQQASRDLAAASNQLAAQQSTRDDLAPGLQELLAQLARLTAATTDGIGGATSSLATMLEGLATKVLELDAALRGDVVGAGTGLATSARAVEQQMLELQRRLSALLDTDR